MTKSEKIKIELLAALNAGKRLAEKHINDDDGGTCNFDTALLKKPAELTKEEFVKVIEEMAKLKCRYDNDRHSIGKGYYHIYGYQSGQANRHSTMAEVFSEALTAAGFDSFVWYQMD